MLLKRFLLMAVLLVPASVLTGTLLFFTGSRFIEAILPVTQRIITLFQPKYVFLECRLLKEARPKLIKFSVIVRNPGCSVFINEIEGLPFNGKFLASNTYVIPIITLSLLIAWPFLSIRKKLVAILLSLPLILLAELITISMFIIWYIDYQVRSSASIAVAETVLHYNHILCIFP